MALRRRSNRTRYLGEREIRQRVSLDQASRAGRPEPYNRRKPSLDSTGTPELQADAVTGPKIAPNEITGTHINGRLPAGSVQQIGDLDGNLPDGKLPNIPKPKLPGDIHYGKINRADITRGAVGDDEIAGVGWSKVGTNNDPTPNFARDADIAASERSLKAFMARHYRKK